MEGNIEEQEEQGIHEATIDLKDGADAFAMECIQACEEVAGKVEVEAVLGLAWDILSMQLNESHELDELDDDIDDHLGFALRVGIAIGQMLRRDSRTAARGRNMSEQKIQNISNKAQEEKK